MISFADIQYRYTVEEYLEKLEMPRRIEVKSMFEVSNLALDMTRRYERASDPLPEIWIRSTLTPNGEAMPGRIYLSEGLINTCLDISLPPDCHSTLELPNNLMLPLPQFALTFCLVHEYMHISRKHNECSIEIGDSQRFSLATEYDADLCSTAVIYRLAQQFYKDSASDRDVRTITLFAILWVTLALPQSDLATTHSSTAERIFSTYTKVCSLTQRLGAPPDPSCAGPECRQVAEYMPQVLLRLAKLHADLHLEKGRILKQILAGFVPGPQRFEAAEAWEEIREIVVAVSEKPKD
ncbi:hypothetical protein J2X54_003296 [Duganella sp. 3397]|uniref:hypothetical protein n=1 Tax=Duganella sp. 3397 TaxID=2817732 RepID=UPI002863C5AB|nr:hypothetical protein [Duganella sp. 3397]MDR7050809.1 hypothetical protein [Duganella sp. 3397]